MKEGYGEETAGKMAQGKRDLWVFFPANQSQSTRTKERLVFLAWDRTGKGVLLSFAWGQPFFIIFKLENNFNML